VRKLIFMLLAAGAVAAALAAIAPAAVVIRCKPGNVTFKCQPTNLHFGTPPVKCQHPGTRVPVPVITVTSNSGITKIQVKVNGKVIKTFRYGGLGPLQKVIRGLHINTTGFGHGVHTITVMVMAAHAPTKSLTRRFSICKTVPIFTG
jgi:hypothetical protein